MIIGVGLDVTEISRIERLWNRFGFRFAKRILGAHELQQLENKSTPIPFLAARFAAKEATVKAFGTGFSEGITPVDIEVHTLPSGQPTLVLNGNAVKRATLLGATRMHISLTHGRDTAAAVVIIEKEECAERATIRLARE